jgi:hypothetical protein
MSLPCQEGRRERKERKEGNERIRVASNSLFGHLKNTNLQ